MHRVHASSRVGRNIQRVIITLTACNLCTVTFNYESLNVKILVPDALCQ